MGNDTQLLPESETPRPRFAFDGIVTVELNLCWATDDARSLYQAEEMMKEDIGRQLAIIRGRIAHVVASPGNMTVKGKLVDIHHQTTIGVRQESHAPAKTPIACGDARLRRPGNEHRPERREAGDCQGTGQCDVGPTGDA